MTAPTDREIDPLAKLVSGVLAYRHEQKAFVRLLRRRGTFTSGEFDRWFLGREWRRPIRRRPLTGDTLVLGMGRNGGSRWAEMLDLLQVMVQLGVVDATKGCSGEVVYSLLRPADRFPT